MSCKRIRGNELKCACFKANGDKFIALPIFSSLYISIQNEKFMKSIPNSNADKNVLAQQIFLIFSISESQDVVLS